MRIRQLTFWLMLTTVHGLASVSAALAQYDPVIAKVNEHEIRVSYVKGQIAKMPLGDQVSVRSNPEQFAESLIQEEVFFQFMLSTNFKTNRNCAMK